MTNFGNLRVCSEEHYSTFNMQIRKCALNVTILFSCLDKRKTQQKIVLCMKCVFQLPFQHSFEIRFAMRRIHRVTLYIRAEMHVGPHVQYPLLLSDFNKNSNMSNKHC